MEDHREEEMKKYIKQPYIAFDPEEATFLFSREFLLPQEQSPVPYIHKVVRRVYFPKKSLITFVISAILIVLMKFIPPEVFGQTLGQGIIVVLALLNSLSLFFLILRSVGVLLETYRLKRFYRRVEWPAQYSYFFYEEGVAIKAIDMEGVFYWDDFLEIIMSPHALIFGLCPPGTPRGRELKAYYPKLHNVYLFIHDDMELQALMQQVGKCYKNVIIK